MSLVVIHAEPDRVRVISDTLEYSPSGLFAEPNPSTLKVVLLEELSAVSVCVGDGEFIDLWQGCAVGFAEYVAARGGDFDTFVDEFPGYVRGGVEKNPRSTPEMACWLAGWSPSRGRHVAYGGTSEDFEFVDVSDRLEMCPSPTGAAPSVVEQAVRRMTGNSPLPDGEPIGDPPVTDDDWEALARRVHDSRATILDPDLMVLMGGDVVLTELQHSQVERRVVATFTETDRAAMLRGTVHPSQQLGPCICGSGVRMLDCHLPEVFENPCVCKSGVPFAECCRIDVPGRNDPCPCRSGRKAKRCCLRR